MKYIINKKGFPSKSKITEHFRKILNSYDCDEKVSKEDLLFLKDLINHHPSAADKIGVGISKIKVEKHDDDSWGKSNYYNHFQIYRKDGTNEDFSFHKCISFIGRAKVKKTKAKVMAAFRCEVHYQISIFKDDAFSEKSYIKCPILNINTSEISCHVDHAPPKTFMNLFDFFLKEESLKWESIILEKIDGVNYLIKDKELSREWRAYHKEKAELRIVHSAGNLSQKKNFVWDGK